MAQARLVVVRSVSSTAVSPSTSIPSVGSGRWSPMPQSRSARARTTTAIANGSTVVTRPRLERGFGPLAGPPVLAGEGFPLLADLDLEGGLSMESWSIVPHDAAALRSGRY